MFATTSSSTWSNRAFRIAWTISAGFLPVVLALVPLLGWLLLPAALIYLVAGVAWQAEPRGRGMIPGPIGRAADVAPRAPIVIP